MSLNFRKGIIYEYPETIRIHHDYFNLLLEKEQNGGPVIVKALELRRKNHLSKEIPKSYRLETNENVIVGFLSRSEIRGATVELYAKRLLEHLVFNYKMNKLRILNDEELLAKRKQVEEDNSGVVPQATLNRQLSMSSLGVLDGATFSANSLEQRDPINQRGKRKAFLNKLSTIRSYFMEQPVELSKLKSIRKSTKSITSNYTRNKWDKPEQPILQAQGIREDCDDRISTTSDDTRDRVLDIQDCGEVVPAHPMWGTPGLRVRKMKNKYLYQHGAPDVDKMLHAKKFSGGFNHKAYISNLSYSQRKAAMPNILLGNAKAGMHGKLYRHWSLRSLKAKRANLSISGEAASNG